jgi:hypothetical protein
VLYEVQVRGSQYQPAATLGVWTMTQLGFWVQDDETLNSRQFFQTQT